MTDFLHNHPMMEKVFKIDQDHVVVDRKDWEEARRRCGWVEVVSPTTTLEEAKELIRKNIEWKVAYPERLGGQSCGMPQQIQELHSEDLDLTMRTSFHRSSLKNRELLYGIFNVALDQLIK